MPDQLHRPLCLQEGMQQHIFNHCPKEAAQLQPPSSASAATPLLHILLFIFRAVTRAPLLSPPLPSASYHRCRLLHTHCQLY